ncbi:MAG: hypothetical protein M1828_006862 [Chrysothrix sp. TS-e1954]|nr:MAG: hypothetical protein M1828_006862 [Chrysothrix sp. TS-e1954]
MATPPQPSRKRPRSPSIERPPPDTKEHSARDNGEDDSTELKLAMLASLYPDEEQEALLEVLLASDGDLEDARRMFAPRDGGAAGARCGDELVSPGYDESTISPRKKHVTERVAGYQSSLSKFTNSANPNGAPAPKAATKKGKTLHLYSPDDIAAHTPCSIVHNFLPPSLADALLRELLEEVPTFCSETFVLFDKVVTSPHTFCFYVDDWTEAERQKKEYFYNGSHVADVRKTLPEMQKTSGIVRDAVNDEIRKRISTHYPRQQKLKYQSPAEWRPNTSFVNCYDGGKESVGYHSDELTYLGPRAVIGSISLGVAREFRVRKVIPRNTQYSANDPTARKADEARADTEGQISIHLPHNSLLVMHAEMQEEWKHSIAPAQAIDPHPIARNRRLNITYRWYRESFHPRFTPRCRCGIPTTLKCVQKQEVNRGRYMWMCHAGGTPGQQGCGFFQWAEFDEDGEPPWVTGTRRKSVSDEAG